MHFYTENDYGVVLSQTDSIFVEVGSNQSIFCTANGDTTNFSWSFNGLQVQVFTYTY